MDVPWRESMNMENLETSLGGGEETIRVEWSDLLAEALKRKHYLASKALLRLKNTLYDYGGGGGDGIGVDVGGVGRLPQGTRFFFYSSSLLFHCYCTIIVYI